MKARKILAVICYTVCLTAYGAAGYVSWLAYTQEISYKLGFLIFLPVWIISFWFSTFFSQLTEKRSGKKAVSIIPVNVRRVLNGISNFLSFALLAYWIYVYAVQLGAA